MTVESIKRKWMFMLIISCVMFLFIIGLSLYMFQWQVNALFHCTLVKEEYRNLRAAFESHYHDKNGGIAWADGANLLE